MFSTTTRQGGPQFAWRSYQLDMNHFKILDGYLPVPKVKTEKSSKSQASGKKDFKHREKPSESPSLGWTF